MNNSCKNIHPLVSIITPGYNGKAFVKRCLDSVLAQTYSNIEYIYVDDGSTDGTSDIVKAYAPRFEEKGWIFKFVQQENKGCSEAVMKALSYINGKYYVSLEYDDSFPPESIERRVELFEKLGSDYGLLICNAINVDEETGNAVGLLIPNSNHLKKENLFETFLNNRGVNTSGCLMFRVDAFDKTHPNREFIASRFGYLWQTTLPVLFSYKALYIDEPLLNYYIRKDSISHKRKNTNDVLNMLAEFESYINKTLTQIPMNDELLKKYQKNVSLHCQTKAMFVCLKRKNIKNGLSFFVKLVRNFGVISLTKKMIYFFKHKV